MDRQDIKIVEVGEGGTTASFGSMFIATIPEDKVYILKSTEKLNERFLRRGIETYEWLGIMANFGNCVISTNDIFPIIIYKGKYSSLSKNEMYDFEKELRR